MPLARAAQLFRRANANKGRIARALARTGKGSFWAMADQGVASIGNFGILFLLGKEFARRGAMGEFANFGMLFELMWFLNTMQGALIIYPLSVKGAMTDRAGLARIAGSGVMLTLLAGPVIGGAAFTMAAVYSTFKVGAWAALAAVVWQVQETSRRALMADLRFRAAICGDAIRYIGHVLFVWALVVGGQFSLERVFQTMVAAAALGAVVQILQVGMRIPAWHAVWDFAREAWRLGRWVLGGNASSLCTTTLFTINFRFWQGADLVGVAFALNNLLRFTNPLMFAVASLITPHAARSRATEGLGPSKRVLLKYGAFGLLMLGPYLAVLIFFPQWCIRLATETAYQKYWWVLVISAITQGLIYLGTMMGVYLNAVERNRLAFVGQIVYSSGFVVIGMPLTAILPGITGPALGGLVASLLMVSVNLWAVRNLPALEKHDQPRGFEVVPKPSATPVA